MNVGARGTLALSALGDARILGELGQGGKSTVYLAVLGGREVALKVYKAAAVVRHARTQALALPEYEFTRNLAFFRAPGLAPHVAEPLAWLETPGIAALVQERLHGQLYYSHCRARGGPDAAVVAQLERVVELAHAAGLHDIDLHAMNVMVAPGPESALLARLFDFNLVPFHVRPRNPLAALLLRAGLWDERRRDRRKLRDLHDFSRIERKLLHPASTAVTRSAREGGGLAEP